MSEETNVTENVQNDPINNTTVTNETKRKGKGGLIVAILLLICIGVGVYFTTFRNEEYVDEAVKYLKSDMGDYEVANEITTNGSQIVYYKDDILVQLSFKLNIPYAGEAQYVYTYSTKRKENIGTLELTEMQLTKEWQNAKTEKIGYFLIQRMNGKYFK